MGKKVALGTYWMVALLGAIIMMASLLVPIDEVGKSLIANTAINPIKILVIFITLTLLSVFLDEIGFFSYIASLALRKAKGSQIKLFIVLYLLASILTVFTSNDIIILTFTPFICFFCKRANINPIPYLVAEFVAANTWSMFLIIGNPTNIYLATSLNISFIDYVKTMYLPTIGAGVTSFLVLFMLFYKKLNTPIENVDVQEVKIADKYMLIIGLAHLILCIIGLSICSYVDIEMWVISLSAAVSLFICISVYILIAKKKFVVLEKTLKRAPLELIPFVLSMFVIVLALKYQGVTQKLYDLLNTNQDGIVYTLTSALFANILNNIPMSVLFSSILQEGASYKAVFGAIVGSNLGAILTPVGALAGIMWSNILRRSEVKYTFVDFMKYGIIIGVPTLVVAALLIL
ncbi:MAG: hypothetical protein K5923_02605 [Clostridia bacterium]|nr:hypothetical protein [Clostridia bacterium]